jgi:hypothetical protein
MDVKEIVIRLQTAQVFLKVKIVTKKPHNKHDCTGPSVRVTQELEIDRFPIKD